MAAVAYWTLEKLIIASQGPPSPLRRAVKRDWKSAVSPALYAVGIAAAFSARWLSVALYVAVALLWLRPDRRIEAALRGEVR